VDARLKLNSGACFDIDVSSGHSITIDGSPEIGGENRGARPMELVLAGLGGCTAMDVLEILKKSRQQVTDVQIKLNAERAEKPPRVFTQIDIHYLVSGYNLREKTVQRAVDLSAEKYCSASIMIGKTATLRHTVEIVQLTPEDGITS